MTTWQSEPQKNELKADCEAAAAAAAAAAAGSAFAAAASAAAAAAAAAEAASYLFRNGQSRFYVSASCLFDGERCAPL